jgi:hypothetical protein
MPRADTSPELKTALSEVPDPTNRLGVRLGAEGGMTAALAAVINAIVDALSELGVRHIECRRPRSECGARSRQRPTASVDNQRR